MSTGYQCFYTSTGCQYRVLLSEYYSLSAPSGLHTEGGECEIQHYIVQLDPLSKADLLWWQSLDRKLLSNRIASTVPSVTIESDASKKGWGIVLNGQTRTGGVWSAEERSHHINYVELLAAFLTLRPSGRIGLSQQSSSI